MKLNPKQLAASAALLGVLACAAALPASAAGPVTTPLALTLPKVSFPWDKVTAESIETGSYDAAPLAGTAQQLSPVTPPANAASKNGVTYVSDNPNVVSVDSEGVAQAVGLGTANITATCGGVSCTYTITPQPDASMIATEMDITLASSTIAVGETTSLSLAVLPTSAANYINVSLSSSNEKVATVNNFGKVTGVAPGKATITATDGNVSCTATVTVVAANTSTVSSQSISLNTNYVVLKPGSSKTITGKGVINAGTIDADTVCIDDVEAASVICKRLIAKRAQAPEIFASESAAVSCFLSAAYVETGKLTVAISEIDVVEAQEVVNLKPKKRSLFGTLLASVLRSFLTALTVRGEKAEVMDAEFTPVQEETAEATQEEPAAEQPATVQEVPVATAEPEMDVVDEELNRIIGLFKLSREQGYTLKLVPGTPEENAPVFDFATERIIRPAA